MQESTPKMYYTTPTTATIMHYIVYFCRKCLHACNVRFIPPLGLVFCRRKSPLLHITDMKCRINDAAFTTFSKDVFLKKCRKCCTKLCPFWRPISGRPFVESVYILKHCLFHEPDDVCKAKL